MSVFKKGGLAAVVVAVGLAACTGLASANATLSTSGPTVPYTGSFQARSSANITFTFATGTITCTHPYGYIGNGTISNASIGTSFATQATIPSGASFLGNNLATTAAASTACTSSIPAVSSCTAQPYPIPAITVAAQDTSTAVNVRFGPITVKVNCTSRSDGSTIVGCQYTTGSTTTAAPVNGVAPYVSGSSPQRAEEITFTSQPFIKTAGPSACPAASPSPGTPGQFSGKVKLFTGSAAGAAQINAYKN